MPVARYFLFVGGVLLALLFAVDALVPQGAIVASTSLSSPGIDKSTVRIHSTQKLPERVVYDTSLPTIVPTQVNAMAAAAPASAQSRVRDTFAQFIPGDRNDASNKPAAEAKVAEAKPEPQTQPAPKKHKVARSRPHQPTQLQPTRYAQPGFYQQPYRVAQQQQRFGFFGGFGSTW
ncbi:hypothetical protein JQ633_20550 [Bradyrhizobium tropiciagri]|uniref:hypothetical protein n=1 Tax=Bradyrhizobium tropiciagri TaxID=312253 RepID=UPI001BA5F0EA|nr:hypothetical protein [Bradyrhizobium tropiciagri]MBR0872765.1 hypothetical protein [Bradyrhizobium tropiciagri]